MNFIRYNPNTGDIVNVGWMASEFVEAEIYHGEPTLLFDGYIEQDKWRVNLDTKQLEPKE